MGAGCWECSSGRGKLRVMRDSNIEELPLEVWGSTDVGMKRRLNEDVFAVRPEIGVFLVADGMGGHAAGEVASRLAADAIVEFLDQRRSLLDEPTWPEHWDRERSAAGNLVVDAIETAHRVLTRAVSTERELKGMGTTIVVAFRPPGKNRLVIAHVGDSRVYRLRRGRLELLTEDHSWVHEQVREGNLSEEAARTHPLKNVVTQALGGAVEPVVDVGELDLERGDLYLLCSDGLNTMLTDEEIHAVLAAGGELQDMGQNLVIAANEHGGNDNITVVLLRVG